MRLFIALNFDEKTKDSIEKVQGKLKAKGRGNFTRRENMHLTLVFLGEIAKERLPEIQAAMDSVEIKRMRLTFSKLGCFQGDAELWWLGIEENRELLRLQKDLSKELKSRGFSLESRKFKAHLTLARQMHIGRVDSMEVLPKAFSTSVSSMDLMLSERIDGKLTYTKLYSI